MALGCFFVGCTTLVAFAFRNKCHQPNAPTSAPSHPVQVWRRKMLALGTALAAAFAVFSVLILIFNNPPASEQQAIWWGGSFLNHPRDLIAPMLASMTLIPSLCLVPYLTMATRSRFAAVIFTLFLVFSMKLLGAIVVVFIYGWDADKQGRTAMPWNCPDLLVWLFWAFSAVLCAAFYLLGKRRFRLSYCKPSAG